MMRSSLIVNAEHSGMLCACFDDQKHKCVTPPVG